MPEATFGEARESATPLIGRRLELSWLRTRLDLASHGYAHLVLVEGEAGIGKTRLVHEFLTEARAAGVRVVRGRCYEHLDLAYLPLRESLFAPLAERFAGNPDRSGDINLLLHPGTDDDDGTTTEAPDAAQRKHTRQLLGITRLVIEFARDGVTALFVDDLDWADNATVDLLRHLLFRVDDEQVPLLIVATSRVEAHARAAAAIARLRGEPRVATISLRPLSELEATALARRLQAGTSVEQARRLAAAGGGNPLLVEALAHQSQQDTWRASAPGDSGAGHPVTAAIAARVQALDDGTRAVVRAAAFLGPRATPDMLGAVLDLDEVGVNAAIAEAIERGVLVDDPGAVTFTHPLFVHTLFAQTPGPAGRELHARIALILTARHEAGAPVEVRALTHHLIGAGDRADPAAVAEYAARAGDEAMALTAWGEASRCYEAAIAAARSETAPRALATLHRSAALAYRGDMELTVAVKHLDAALDVLGADAAPAELADLHLWRIRCGVGSQELLSVVRDRAPLEAVVEIVEPEHPELAAEALVELAQSYWVEWDMERSSAAAERAMAIAEQCGSSRAFVRAATTLCVPQWARYDLERSLRTLEAGIEHARASGDDTLLVGGPLFRAPLTLAWLGRHAEAESLAHEGLEAAERSHYPLEEGLPLAALVQIAVARGDFAEAEQHAHQALLVQRLSGYQWAAGLYLPALASAYVARGRYDAAHDALATWDETGDEIERTACALFQRYVTAFERGFAVRGEPLPRLPRAPMIGLDAWAAACVEIARREGLQADVQRAHDLLAEVDRRGGTFTSSLVALVPRVLGVARDLLGEEDAAIDTLRRAIAVARDIGAHAEHARAQIDLATILQRRGERQEAAVLVDEALAALDRLGMAPDAERATALIGPTSGSTRTSSEQATVTRATSVILFSDVVDSTRLTEELGAVGYRRRARQVEELITSTIVAHGGSIVTGISLGDGFIGLFPSVEQAITAARRCAAEVPSTGLHLHLALHQGEILLDGPRIYGSPVNYAARLCGLSGPDEILVSAAIRDAGNGIPGVAFVDRGSHDLKGIAGAQPVSALVDDTGGGDAREL